VEFESPHLHQLGCCWLRSARKTAWSTPASCWTGAAHSVLLDDDDAPDPEKVMAAVTELLGRKPHYAKRIGRRRRPRRQARPHRSQQGAVEHHPAQDALDTAPLVPVDHCE
jgi:hypothetical protein